MISDHPRGISPHFPVIATITMLLLSCSIMAQSRLANPTIELKDNNLHVTYDIQEAKRSDRFTVRLEVTDSEGNVIPVNSLTGDVGESIRGGNRKEIVWNLEADSIIMNADIYIQIFADAVVIPEKLPESTEEKEEVVAQADPVPPPEEEETDDPAAEVSGQATMEETQPGGETSRTDRDESQPEGEMPAGESEMPAVETAREFSRTGIILQSLPMPGLGLSRVTGKPHWLRGVAAYGCVAGAVVFNNMAVATYEDYKTPSSAEEASSLFDQTVTQDLISEVCAYAAIGIWVSDIIWTVAGTSDLGKKGSAGNSPGFRIGTRMDPLSGAPLLAIRYKF